MHDADAVPLGDRVAELQQRLLREPRFDGPSARHGLGDGLALQELHREPRHLRRRVDARRDDVDDVLALDPRADPCLLREAFTQARIGDELRVHGLERALLTRAELLGDVDRAHASFAERANDPEVRCEDASGEKGRRRHDRSVRCVADCRVSARRYGESLRSARWPIPAISPRRGCCPPADAAARMTVNRAQRVRRDRV